MIHPEWMLLLTSIFKGHVELYPEASRPFGTRSYLSHSGGLSAVGKVQKNKQMLLQSPVGTGPKYLTTCKNYCTAEFIVLITNFLL